jgi:ATP-dependent DNA helicase PIF1
MKQSEAEEILKMGHNVLLTGPAGCGKTFLLNKYINYLRKKKIRVGITASTGIAATHLGGRTIHSWCRIDLNETMSAVELKKVINNKLVKNRVRYSNTLIIDEISMLNANRLDLVDDICKAIRQDLRSFGGLQIILCGDFFQLPPITQRGGDNNHFITESKIWKKMDIKICYLEEQFRQNDKKFIDVLNCIRSDNVTTETSNILNERLNKPINSDFRPTKLNTHNDDVDAYNLLELNKLPGDEMSYEMQSSGIPKLVESLKKSCLAYQSLTLKEGAIVMFIKNNFDKKYVNGTLGKVIGFDEDSKYPLIETISGDVIIAYPESWKMEENNETPTSINQVPLRLAWAITIHKSQGMSLDCAEIDLSKTFEFGMGYVALSRVRSLEGIKLVGINELALKVSKEATALDKVLKNKAISDLEEYKNMNKSQVKKAQKIFIKECEKENTLY